MSFAVLALAGLYVRQDCIEFRHVLRIDLADRRILRLHQHGEERRVHGEVLARHVHVVAGDADELCELAVDHLGGIEHCDEADKIARKHAIE